LTTDDLNYLCSMKKSILLIIIGIILHLNWIPGGFAQKSDAYQSHWQTGQSPKDGEAFVNKMFSDQKSQFTYYVSNDGNNVYIFLMTADRANIQKIMKYGLTTWVNPDGKSKKGLGVQFPVPSDESESSSSWKGGGKPENGGSGGQKGQGAGGGDRKEMMNRMLAGKNKEIVLIGFSGKGSRDTVQITPDLDFKGNLEMMEGGNLLVSLTLPIKKIESTGKEQADGLLGIGFETGYMDLNESGMGGGGGQSSDGGGHGGGGGGMYGGGGPPPSSQGFNDKSQGSGSTQQKDVTLSELANPTRMWIGVVKLATE
jgi:hypothetical protein